MTNHPQCPFWGEIEMDCVARYFIIDINFSECCYGDTGDNYFSTDFFLSALPLLPPTPLSFLPPSKPFHSCWVLVLHKLPSGILNQSPATKGESLWLITERRAHNAHRQTHGEAKGGWSLRARKLTPLQKTWPHMRKRKRRRRGSANLGEACIGHPSYSLSAHYFVINRGAVLKEGGINQLSWVNVLQPHYEPWVAL